MVGYISLLDSDACTEAPEVSTNSLNRIMGHVNGSDTFRKHYQSDISGVDIKGIVLRGKPDQGYSTEALRRNRRLRRTPTRLPSRAHQMFLAKWKEATYAEPDISRATHGNRARKAAWKELRSTWTEHFKTTSSPQPRPSSKIKDSVELFGNLDEAETKSRIMMRYDEHRNIIEDEIANPDYSLRTSLALDSMSTLARRDYSHPAVFYPGTEPIGSKLCDAECRFCHGNLERYVKPACLHRSFLHLSHSHSSLQKVNEATTNTRRGLCCPSQNAFLRETLEATPVSSV
jgi:hypothetical protein